RGRRHDRPRPGDAPARRGPLVPLPRFPRRHDRRSGGSAMTIDLIVHEILGTLTIGAIAIGVLVLAEVLKRNTNLPTELTRKFAHIGSGMAVLLIPAFISSSWTVLILAAGFAGLMFGTHVTGLLQGVHGVG